LRTTTLLQNYHATISHKYVNAMVLLAFTAPQYQHNTPVYCTASLQSLNDSMSATLYIYKIINTI